MNQIKRKTLIAPSLLAADFSELGAQLEQAEAAGADWHHVDVMDGHFVPNISLGPAIVRACQRVAAIPLDVHLMIENPDKYLEAFAKAGADQILIHEEASPDLEKSIAHIKKLGCKAGVVINPGTTVNSIESILAKIDIVLVMSVEPGFGGQHFMPEVLPKVQQIREWIDAQQLSCQIEIDGGIDQDTIASAYAAGVDVFVAGTAIYGHPNGISEGINLLKSQLA
jgi:ribulose-phosphate 3-epimerase